MGVFFIATALFSNSSYSSPSPLNLPQSSLSKIQDQCLMGFDTHKIKSKTENTAFEYKTNEGVEATLNPQIIQWMDERSWQEGYQLWQESRQGVCQSPQDGYNFLLMHHHLTHTLESVWPNLEDHSNNWAMFPASNEDYPDILENQFHAWPDNVRRATMLIKSIPQMSQEELLSYWKNEGALGQWIQCGSVDTDQKNVANVEGMNIDSLYGALQFNGLSNISEHNLANPKRQLNAYLFWQMHEWINKVWMMYRMKMGEKLFDPDFQADLINQCLIHYSLAEKSRLNSNTQQKPKVKYDNKAPLYKNGQLNPAYKGKAARLLGEVIDIKTTAKGKQHFKLDLNLKGIKPIWATSYAKLAGTPIKLGDRLVFIGHIKTPTLLIARSIQTPK